MTHLPKEGLRVSVQSFTLGTHLTLGLPMFTVHCEHGKHSCEYFPLGMCKSQLCGPLAQIKLKFVIDLRNSGTQHFH